MGTRIVLNASALCLPGVHCGRARPDLAAIGGNCIEFALQANVHLFAGIALKGESI